jgi:hypothetical protein
MDYSGSRWKCRECGSYAVQISLPAWYFETTSFELTFMDTDSEAEPMYWHCTDCEEGGRGLPDEVQTEVAIHA